MSFSTLPSSGFLLHEITSSISSGGALYFEGIENVADRSVKEKAGTSQGRGELVFDIATSAISYIKIGKVAKIANAVDNVSDVASGAKTAAGAGKNVAKSANKADNIGQVANSCPKGSKACFTAGTQIVVGAEYSEELNTTVYVTVNIEDIEIGDLVYSYDTVTGTITQQEVTTTFALESDHINYLTVVNESGNEQVIETTDSHPFWVVTDSPDLERAARAVVDENGVTLYHENLESNLNGFWVEAKDLREGDVFLGANGELSTLVTSERVVFPVGIKVYNFTVAGNHDYFVIAETDEYGQTCILVHNGRCAKNKIKPSPDATGPHTVVRRDAQGHVTHYVEYTPNPRNPTGFDEVKRVDTQYSDFHFHKGIPTPHTHTPDITRPSFPEELPE